ncbi:hypothetical protein [Enhygromyxa salina]|uniref:Uncharacterized protein n=1 Tax=Enhygromyxa salina TaxID=215803 RepID=A0A2S9XIK5_9BACT|nr:hypothetical protein [Enhygromyxa salina]PRP92667.1 hypothetical protein ENSA7_81560 [Enhygromyxa salina]
MAGKISSFASGLQGADGARAATVISTNTRVQTTRGFIGLVTDSVIFPATTGVWFLSNQRVTVNNTPTIGASVGVYPHPVPGSSGAMLGVESDSRVDAM